MLISGHILAKLADSGINTLILSCAKLDVDTPKRISLLKKQLLKGKGRNDIPASLSFEPRHTGSFKHLTDLIAILIPDVTRR